MNRDDSMDRRFVIHKPRMRGDEPRMDNTGRVELRISPACAGMNRYNTSKKRGGINKPRMRGDEPKED